jgi:hypothetical protein
MTPKHKHWSDAIPDDACIDAKIWARTQKTKAVAWRTCGRGDWILD